MFGSKIAPSILSCIFESVSLVCLVASIYKLVLIFRKKGFKMTIPVIILLFQIMALISDSSLPQFITLPVRMLQILDPLITQGVWSWSASIILINAGYPFLIACSLLIAFYWEETMRVSQLSSPHSLESSDLQPFPPSTSSNGRRSSASWWCSC